MHISFADRLRSFISINFVEKINIYLCLCDVSSNLIVSVLHSAVSFSMSCLWPCTIPSSSDTVATIKWQLTDWFNSKLFVWMVLYTVFGSSWINYWQRQFQQKKNVSEIRSDFTVFFSFFQWQWVSHKWWGSGLYKFNLFLGSIAYPK